jgi:hypothetical protein
MHVLRTTLYLQNAQDGQNLTLTKTFEEGVLLAVNHSGDSDSTGSIAGNLLGAIHGEDSIPSRWLNGLELRELIARVAENCLYSGRDSALIEPIPL